MAARGPDGGVPGATEPVAIDRITRNLVNERMGYGAIESPSATTLMTNSAGAPAMQEALAQPAAPILYPNQHEPGLNAGDAGINLSNEEREVRE